MKTITYSLFFVYAIPAFFIAFSGLSTDGFSSRQGTIYFASAISGTFFTMFRDTFGSIIVPLVTAYAVPKRDINQEISKETIQIFLCLIIFLAFIIVLYGYIKFHEGEIKLFNVEPEDGSKAIQDIPKIFQDTILMYAKETLAYIALVLGISLKK